MSVIGASSLRLMTVGEIVATNRLRFHPSQSGLAVAADLLSSHTAGAPVVDDRGRYVGFITECDVMNALDAGKNLGNLTAEDLMQVGPIAVHEFTTIADAAKRMAARGGLNLPVEKEGTVAYSVSRHDLLRAWVGLDLGDER